MITNAVFNNANPHLYFIFATNLRTIDGFSKKLIKSIVFSNKGCTVVVLSSCVSLSPQYC